MALMWRPEDNFGVNFLLPLSHFTWVLENQTQVPGGTAAGTFTHWTPFYLQKTKMAYPLKSNAQTIYYTHTHTPSGASPSFTQSFNRCGQRT